MKRRALAKCDNAEIAITKFQPATRCSPCWIASDYASLTWCSGAAKRVPEPCAA